MNTHKGLGSNRPGKKTIYPRKQQQQQQHQGANSEVAFAAQPQHHHHHNSSADKAGVTDMDGAEVLYSKAHGEAIGDDKIEVIESVQLLVKLMPNIIILRMNYSLICMPYADILPQDADALDA